MKKSVYTLLATAGLLTGMFFIVYCGSDSSGPNPEGSLAQDPNFCHKVNTDCTYDTDCCFPTQAGDPVLVCKKKDKNSSKTCLAS